MKKNYTHISMVIDRSGSMSSCWSDVKGGYTEIISKNKATPGECTFTIVVFDDQIDIIENFQPIATLNEQLNVNPRGYTALLDAIGKTIVVTGEKLASLPEDERPEKVIVMVQTDGHENCSKEFNRDAIKKMVDEQSKKYNWEFMFLGASWEAVNDAVSFGFKSSKAAVYKTSKSGETFGLWGDKMSAMRSATDSESYATASSFSDSDREQIS